MCESRREEKWIYKVEIAYLEIYNEEIRDLLQTDITVKKPNISYNNNEATVNDLLVSFQKFVTVYNFTYCFCFCDDFCDQFKIVTNEREVNNVLVQGQRKRAVAATDLNKGSSRSHVVVMIKISGRNEATSATCSSNTLTSRFCLH